MFLEPEQIEIIKHFIQLGFIGKEWDYLDSNEILFQIHEQIEEEEFPSINTDESIKISIEIEEDTVEKLVEYPITLKLQEGKKDNKIFYKYDEKEEFFYLNEVIKYDIWKDTIEKVEEIIKDVDEEYREEYKANMFNSLRNICPEGKDAVAIYYEDENNAQLRFLSKEYLEKEVVYESQCSGMMYFSEDKEGMNGYYKRVEVICPVDKDFHGELELELFSKYESIPKEVISFTL